MRNLKYILVLLCPLCIIACSKPYGDNMGVDNYKEYEMVYAANAIEDDSRNTMVVPMGIDTFYRVYANFGGLNFPGEDIQVKFKIAPELIDDYNEENQTSYPIMLPESYTVANYDAVIKKGELLSNPIRIDINTGAFDGVGKFLLPVHIESAGPNVKINEDLRTVFLLINGYYDSNPFPIYDRTLWSIAGFSTDETEAITGYPQNGRAISAIDGSGDSFWCTQWRSAKPGPPHWIAVDMGEEKELHGVVIRGRSTGIGSETAKSNGNPRIFYVEVSDDNENWERAGYYEVVNLLEYPVYFDHKKTCRYFRITITASQADFYGTHIAELYAF